MPNKNVFPCGHILDRYEPVVKKVTDPTTGRVTLDYEKMPDGKLNKLRHIKGDVFPQGGDLFRCNVDGKVFRSVPYHYEAVKALKTPDASRVVE